MKTESISQLARAFGLSRSTLLYYDRIGLLPPSGRTAAGYRVYTRKDHQRLERICHFRNAGLTLADMRSCLKTGGRPKANVLERRLNATTDEILILKTKQRLLAGMLTRLADGGRPPCMDKKMWVEMLRAAGMDDQAMGRWHAEFESRAPAAHQEFLLSLGIAPAEAQRIREWSAKHAGEQG